MLRARLVSMVFTVGLVLVLHGCSETSTQRMIHANDHNGLANYYAKQAQELREKAKHWEMTAEYYDKHSEPHGKTEPAQHAAPNVSGLDTGEVAWAAGSALSQELLMAKRT